MKHLRPFNEATSEPLNKEAQDILNIALDEGLIVKTYPKFGKIAIIGY